MLQRNPLIPRMPLLPILDHLEVKPVSREAHRPYWSVMIPTYNRPELLGEALKSVLIQDPGSEEMQIAVLDNGSTVGDVETLVKEIGQGRVEYYRHPENIGFQRNATECINRARGHWIHILHDDNVLLPGFYEANRQHIATYHCNVVFSQAVVIVGDDYTWQGISNRVEVVNGVVRDPRQIIYQFATFILDSLVAARSVYEQTGGYTTRFFFGCDHELCSRIFEVAQVGFLPRPYLMSRLHEKQDSSTDNFTRKNVIHEYLLAYQYSLRGSGDTAENRRLVYNTFGQSLQLVSRNLVIKQRYRDALRLGIWAFRVSPSTGKIANILYIFSVLLHRLYKMQVIRVRHVLGKLKRFVLRIAWK